MLYEVITVLLSVSAFPLPLESVVNAPISTCHHAFTLPSPEKSFWAGGSVVVVVGGNSVVVVVVGPGGNVVVVVVVVVVEPGRVVVVVVEEGT